MKQQTLAVSSETTKQRTLPGKDDLIVMAIAIGFVALLVIAAPYCC